MPFPEAVGIVVDCAAGSGQEQRPGACAASAGAICSSSELMDRVN